ncbi:TetR/AcrR family transcriptional regulator [Conexibacter sp. SYSU D00693]|uniref:TetR/AcrR family transcriptional regulator n=1 Tax=Conexibacter sp. SYSU D00693 TaxID=2812560 RepID=UPI00196A5FC6|nr:TetR/AcrR family transcriptional regulator [Conexibacter sp. SYSU D00693]
MTSTRAYGGQSAEARRAGRRERLMDAAYTLLTEHGPAALTVTGVCGAAKLTARYFYEHFDNREALVQAIVEAETDAVIEATLAAALTAEGGPQERAVAATRALLATTDADPRRLRMAQEHDELVLRMRQVVADRMVERLVEHAEVAWGPMAGDVRPERLRLAASLAVGGVLQLVADWAAGQTAMDRDELAEVAARFAVQTGIAVLS